MDIILSAVKAFTLSNTCLGIENQSWSSSMKYQVYEYGLKVQFSVSLG